MGPVGLQSGKTAQGKCLVTFDFTEGRSPQGPPLPEGAMPLSGLLCTCLTPSFLKGRLSKPGYSTCFCGTCRGCRPHLQEGGTSPQLPKSDVGCPGDRWSVPGTSGSMGVLALHSLALLLLPGQRVPAHSFPLTTSKGGRLGVAQAYAIFSQMHSERHPAHRTSACLSR